MRDPSFLAGFLTLLTFPVGLGESTLCTSDTSLEWLASSTPWIFCVVGSEQGETFGIRFLGFMVSSFLKR